MVEKVLDGDSLRIRNGRKIHEIRLWGIDCPEYGQPYGAAARKLTRKIVAGRQVQVIVKDRDSYGRLVGIVAVNDLVVNEELVRQGAAWVYDYYCREAVCNDWQQLEKRARIEGLGLWRERKRIAPWQWRRGKR